MACGRLAVLVFASVVSALYEAPQGGCSIPPGYDDPVQRAARVAAVPKPRPKPPPPSPQESEQDMQERLERELYERESMVQLSGLGGDAAEDWDEVERQQQRELAFRELLKMMCLVLVVAYALYHCVNYAQRLVSTRPVGAESAAKPGVEAKEIAKKLLEPDSPDAAPKPPAAEEPLEPADDDVEPEIETPASADDSDDSEGDETEDSPAAAAGGTGEHDE